MKELTKDALIVAKDLTVNVIVGGSIGYTVSQAIGADECKASAIDIEAWNDEYGELHGYIDGEI